MPKGRGLNRRAHTKITFARPLHPRPGETPDQLTHVCTTRSRPSKLIRTAAGRCSRWRGGPRRALRRGDRVVPAAVDLDHEPVLGPVEVDFEAVQVGVDVRFGVAERQERVLACALRARASGVVELDRPLEHVQLAASGDAGHRVAHSGLDEAPAVGRFVDDVGELVGREDVGEVDQRAVDRGHRDAVVRRDVTRVE